MNKQASVAVTHSTDESFAAVEVRVAQSIPTQPYSSLYQHWQQWRPPYYHSSQPVFTPLPLSAFASSAEVYNNLKAEKNRSSSPQSVCLYDPLGKHRIGLQNASAGCPVIFKNKVWPQGDFLGITVI